MHESIEDIIWWYIKVFMSQVDVFLSYFTLIFFSKNKNLSCYLLKNEIKLDKSQHVLLAE